MITANSARLRDIERDQLARIVSEHVSSGGQIETLEHTERAPYRPISHQRTYSSKTHNAREVLRKEARISEYGKALAAIGLTASQAKRKIEAKYDVALTVPKVEQIAARGGYAYADLGRKK